MNKYVVLLLACCFIACKSDDQAQTAVLKETGLFSITIPEIGNEAGPALQYLADSNELLYLVMNRDNGTTPLYHIDLATRKIAKTTYFSFSGGNPLVVHGFQYHNRDSIFLTNFFKDTIFLAKLSGNVTRAMPYSYVNTASTQTVNRLIPFPTEPFVVKKGKLLMSPYISPEPRLYYDKRGLLFSYDLKSGIMEDMGVRFPKDYVMSPFFSTDSYYCYDGKNVVFSAQSSHDIWVYNLENQKFSQYPCPTSYFKGFINNDRKAQDFKSALHTLVNHTTYQDIAYDSYREVYYRFVHPGEDEPADSKNLALYGQSFPTMSIIVMDKEFHKIGETLFTGSKFNFFCYYIDKEGLKISTNVPSSPDYDANLLRFTNLKLIRS